MAKSAQFIPVFDSSSRAQFIAAFKSSVTPSFVFGLPFNRVCEDDTMIKNVANQVVDFLLLSTTDGSAVTTGTPAVYYKGDGGTQTIGTGMISHKGLGEWEYIPVQAETNFNHIVFLATLTGAFSQAVNIYTKTGDAYTAVAALNNISSADVNAACDTALSDYGANTTTPPTAQEIRSEIDAYSTQLSTLAARLTATRAGYIDKLNVTGTLANSDTASLYQTSLTGIATSTEIASIDTLIDAIKLVTDKLVIPLKMMQERIGLLLMPLNRLLLIIMQVLNLLQMQYGMSC